MAKRESDEIAAALPDVSGQKRLKVKTSSSSCSDHTSSAFNGQHNESADAISRQFDALQRGTLRWRLEKALEKGAIDEAERISDAIYNDEFLQRQPAPVSSSVGNDAGKNKLKSPKKRTRPSWRSFRFENVAFFVDCAGLHQNSLGRPRGTCELRIP
ncbi:hypothetical protein AAHC03_0459 [Spirometra sp. Aus1]